MADEASEGFVQTSRLLFEASDFDVDSGGAELFESPAADFGIGIGHRGHNSMNACRDQRVGARSSAALMRMRFEVDVERASAGSFTRGREGLNFGVSLASEL